jgi:hypothetical protein
VGCCRSALRRSTVHYVRSGWPSSTPHGAVRSRSPRCAGANVHRLAGSAAGADVVHNAGRRGADPGRGWSLADEAHAMGPAGMARILTSHYRYKRPSRRRKETGKPSGNFRGGRPLIGDRSEGARHDVGSWAAGRVKRPRRAAPTRDNRDTWARALRTRRDNGRLRVRF